MYTGYYKGPLGYLKIVASVIGVHNIEFASEEQWEEEGRGKLMLKGDVTGEEGTSEFGDDIWNLKDYEMYIEVCRQLSMYFEGKLKHFDLPLRPAGTDFQKKVWRMLLTIPYGETKSYKDIAELAGSPGSARAVGLANNRNPIVIVIPCHRVIGANGSMTGYGGGVENKAWLLEHERCHSAKKDA